MLIFRAKHSPISINADGARDSCHKSFVRGDRPGHRLFTPASVAFSVANQATPSRTVYTQTVRQGVAGTLSLEQAKNMEDRLTLVEGRVAVAENVKIKRYNFQVWDGHPNTFDTGVPRERRIIYGIERLTPSVNMGSVIGGFSISMDGKGVLTISASGTNGGRFTFSGSAFVVYRE